MNTRITVGVEIDNSAGIYSDADVLWDMVDILERIGGAEEAREYGLQLEALDEAEEYYNEAIDDLYREIEDAINSVLVRGENDFVYFGASEHESGVWGFWPSVAAVEDAMADGTVVSADDIPSYVLVTNDHGNQTLYRVQLAEVWSVV